MSYARFFPIPLVCCMLILICYITDILQSWTGNFGAMWTRMELDMDSTSAYKIIFEGLIGDGSQGDIAIDDISFTPGCKFFA